MSKNPLEILENDISKNYSQVSADQHETKQYRYFCIDKVISLSINEI